VPDEEIPGIEHLGIAVAQGTNLNEALALICGLVISIFDHHETSSRYELSATGVSGWTPWCISGLPRGKIAFVIVRRHNRHRVPKELKFVTMIPDMMSH